MRNLFPRALAAGLALIAATLILGAIDLLARRESIRAGVAGATLEVVASPSAPPAHERVMR